MFDPAALGTLLIGLNAERAENHKDRRREAVSTPRRDRIGIRVALARGLRRTAAVLDQPTVGEAAS